MDNPYEVLGIKQGASEAEIKAAYREQVKKYHPDKYQNNPLYDLAEEKLRDVNEAYEQLSKGNGSATKGYSSSNQGNRNTGAQAGSNSNDPNSEFYKIRMTIDQGNVDAASLMLNKMKIRNAEWFYLSGVISYRKGWFDEAYSNIQTASSMDPGNYEYRNTLNQISRNSGGFRTASGGRGYGSGNDDLCRMMQCFICTDLMCDCI
jgi:molecular chaperone DnaJ